MHICNDQCPMRNMPQDLAGNHIVPTYQTPHSMTPEQWREFMNTPLDAALRNYTK